MSDGANNPFIEARDFLLRNGTDYAAAYAGFRWPVLSKFNWALDYFDQIASGNDALALRMIDDAGRDEAISFQDISVRSTQVAAWLRSLGVRRGDHVLLMLDNVLPLWECFLAGIKLGAVVIPATTLLSRDDLIDRFVRGQVRHVITNKACATRFDGLDPSATRINIEGGPGWHDYRESAKAPKTLVPDGETAGDDPMLLYFTSGTTAKPKLVRHSHQSYPVGHLTTMYWLGVRPGDLHLNISSPGWAKHAWSSFFAPWNAGAGILVLNQARFSAKATLDAIERCGVTTFCAPPTVWRLLIQEDIANWKVKLRELVSAGEPLNPEVIQRVRAAWGLTIRDGYGQTETTLQIGNSPGQVIKPGSVGRPMPGYRVRLLDPDGNDTDEGEIALDLAERPLGLMQSYQKDDGRAELVAGAAYRTGDIAARDADGWITYVGRSDDVFKASDYRISPFELESALLEHPAVAEAAVVPAPDPVRTSAPKAFITLVAGQAADAATAKAILIFARDRLAPYQRIRRLEFYELPKTMSGKIRRVELRRLEIERYAKGERAAQEFRLEEFSE